MKVLVTGAAGFIGFHTAKKLLQLGHTVVGLDNINSYYDVTLKYGRLEVLGIPKASAEHFDTLVSSATYGTQFQFIRMHLESSAALQNLFAAQEFDVVCHLAAQPGVRYSIENPHVYVQSNVVGFLNILEACRHHNLQHLVYASSSSVYGSNSKIPFEATDTVDHPISLYAATKKSNELMAHTYSHLYDFPTTGLRFFTVYGPWGRPDMAMSLFTDAIANQQPIKVFNHGKMERDFTYVDDIVEGVVRVLEKPVRQRTEKYKVYNIGNNKSVLLLDFIQEIEKNLQTTATKEFLPMQPGDVERTWADVSELIRDYNYQPKTSVADGVQAFVEWYLEYYRK